MSGKHTTDLTTGPVFKKTILFTLPIFFNGVLQQLYSAADTIIIGKYGSETALAGVGSTISLIGLLMGLFSGLAVAVNILCANYFGAKQQEKLQRCMHSSLVLAVVGGIGMGIAGYLASKPMLLLMGCPENVIEQASLYMRIYFCGVPFTIVFNFSASILRAHGDTRRPMLLLIFTGLLNVLLNLLFVVAFRIDIAGVALATVFSQFVSAAVLLFILFRPQDAYRMEFQKLRLHHQDLKDLIAKGIPCGLNGIAFSIANVLLQSTLNTFGDIAISGYAISANLIYLIAQVSAAFYNACVSFSGQCYGAKKFKRIDKLLVSSILGGAIGVCVICSILTTAPNFWLGLYTNSPEILEAAKPYLMVVGWSYLLHLISESANGCLRGMGKSVVPTVLNIGSICICRIVWVLWIFPLHPTLNMLFTCFPVSYLLSTIAQMTYYFICRKQLYKKAVLPGEIIG